jgi:hypothetical protein
LPKALHLRGWFCGAAAVDATHLTAMKQRACSDWLDAQPKMLSIVRADGCEAMALYAYVFAAFVAAEDPFVFRSACRQRWGVGAICARVLMSVRSQIMSDLVKIAWENASRAPVCLDALSMVLFHPSMSNDVSLQVIASRRLRWGCYRAFRVYAGRQFFRACGDGVRLISRCLESADVDARVAAGMPT